MPPPSVAMEGKTASVSGYTPFTLVRSSFAAKVEISKYDQRQDE